jgi:CDP-diglyceride synthetase
MKVNVKAFALALGIFWGLCLCFLPWWVMLFSGYRGETILGKLYLGYSISPLGSLVGLAWGFVDGAISGALLAWLYNTIARWLTPKATS